MIFAIDFETHLLKQGISLPRPVCAGVLWRGSSAWKPSSLPLLREDALDAFERMLRDPAVTIVNHNLAFDAGVLVAERPSLLRLVMDAYDAGRMRCTLVRQILLDIAAGEAQDDKGKPAFRRDGDRVAPALYRLSDLTDWHLREHLEKEDSPRLHYGELDGVPLHLWAEDDRAYPQKDVAAALGVFDAQTRRASFLRAHSDYDGFWEAKDGEIPDELAQARNHFALTLMSAHGIRTSREHVAELALQHHAIQRDTMARLQMGPHPAWAPGPILRAEGSKDTKLIQARVRVAYERRGVAVPETNPSKKFPNGQVKMDGETLENSGDPDLAILGASLSETSTVNTWLPWLEAAVDLPICASYWPLVASGRLSAREPNWTNPPRKGAIRGCVAARRGRLLAGSDYDTAELRSHAQNCLELLGWSEMADAFRRGEDPHLSLAAELLGLDYATCKRRYGAGDTEVEEARQFCKVGNFGFPGGLGADGFVEYARGYGYDITPERGAELREAWFRRWPENRAYFKLIHATIEHTGVLSQLPSKRVRGGLRFTAAANTMFQGRTADGAKLALWWLIREAYLGDWMCEPRNDDERVRKARGERSPYFGSRPIILMHDEVIAEVPDPIEDAGVAGRAAERQAAVMRQAMQTVTPDVPALCSPVLTRRWHKGAKAVRSNDNLRPSRPEKAAGKTTWVLDDEERERQAA